MEWDEKELGVVERGETNITAYYIRRKSNFTKRKNNITFYTNHPKTNGKITVDYNLEMTLFNPKLKRKKKLDRE